MKVGTIALIFFLFAATLTAAGPAENGSPFIAPQPLADPADEPVGTPLINLLPEDTVIWETIDGAHDYRREPMAAAPYPHRGTLPFLAPGGIVPLLVPGTPRATYVQPFQSFRTAIYVMSDPVTLFGKSGLSLAKGVNSVSTGAGGLAVMDRLGAYWSFRHLWNQTDQRIELHRAYATVRLGKFLIEGGRDTVNFGPGEWGLLLSSNAAPFWMLKFQNIEPISFYGLWSFVILNGWLFDQRRDHSNPLIFAARVVYQPVGWVEIGVSRTEMYGGTGRPTYQIHEFPEVIFGGKDNVPGGRFDNDGYAAIDLTFSLPMERWNDTVKSLRFYFQEAGTDIAAPWQPEDRIFTFPWIFFHLFERAYLMGLTMSTTDHFFRLEYAKTALSFYQHHMYRQEGYTYRGLSLGHPLGRNFQSIFFKHRWNARPWLMLEYRIGLYQVPAHAKADHKSEFALSPLFTLHGGVTRYWGETTVTVPFRNWFFELYGRIDGGTAYDDDPNPVEYRIVHTPRVTGGGGLTVGAKF